MRPTCQATAAPPGPPLCDVPPDQNAPFMGTADNATKLSRLALYARCGHRTTPSLMQVQGKLGAYRTVSRDAALGCGLTSVPEDKKATLIPDGWFDTWADATFATDPAGGGKTLRAPNGVVQDGLD